MNNYERFGNYKQIKVPEDLHKALKMAAAEEQTTMVKLIWQFINKRKPKSNYK